MPLSSTSTVSYNPIFYVNSSEILTVTFVDGSSNPVNPTTTNVTIYDPFWQVIQVSDNTTIANPTTGTIVFTVLPGTLYSAGVFVFRWNSVMPDDTQIQFDIPIIVDTAVR